MQNTCQSTTLGTATMKISTHRTAAVAASVPVEMLTDDSTPAVSAHSTKQCILS